MSALSQETQAALWCATHVPAPSLRTAMLAGGSRPAMAARGGEVHDVTAATIGFRSGFALGILRPAHGAARRGVRLNRAG